MKCCGAPKLRDRLRKRKLPRRRPAKGGRWETRMCCLEARGRVFLCSSIKSCFRTQGEEDRAHGFSNQVIVDESVSHMAGCDVASVV